MLSQLRKRKQQEGFTIIEVMIVLAIAGLILLVVFLAVPALQRNARNTQRREDAGNLLSAVSEYESNNNGSTPATASALGASGATAATVGTSPANTVPVNLGYYDPSKVSIVNYTSGMTNTTSTDSAIIVIGASCSGNAPATGSGRSVVILYQVENNALQCKQS